MRRVVPLLTVLFAAALLACGLGTAAAEPAKNRVLASASCDDGEEYVFLIDGEGNAGRVLGSKANVVVLEYEVSYVDPDTGERVVADTFYRGEKNGLRGDRVRCAGTTAFDHWQLGEVTAVFEFEGFVTPRG